MAYTKHTWTPQELITADKLNNIENGIDVISSKKTIDFINSIKNDNINFEYGEKINVPIELGLSLQYAKYISELKKWLFVGYPLGQSWGNQDMVLILGDTKKTIVGGGHGQYLFTNIINGQLYIYYSPYGGNDWKYFPFDDTENIKDFDVSQMLGGGVNEVDTLGNKIAWRNHQDSTFSIADYVINDNQITINNKNDVNASSYYNDNGTTSAGQGISLVENNGYLSVVFTYGNYDGDTGILIFDFYKDNNTFLFKKDTKIKNKILELFTGNKSKAFEFEATSNYNGELYLFVSSGELKNGKAKAEYTIISFVQDCPINFNKNESNGVYLINDDLLNVNESGVITSDYFSVIKNTPKHLKGVAYDFFVSVLKTPIGKKIDIESILTKNIKEKYSGIVDKNGIFKGWKSEITFKSITANETKLSDFFDEGDYYIWGGWSGNREALPIDGGIYLKVRRISETYIRQDVSINTSANVVSDKYSRRLTITFDNNDVITGASIFENWQKI